MHKCTYIANYIHACIRLQIYIHCKTTDNNFQESFTLVTYLATYSMYSYICLISELIVNTLKTTKLNEVFD